VAVAEVGIVSRRTRRFSFDIAVRSVEASVAEAIVRLAEENPTWGYRPMPARPPQSSCLRLRRVGRRRIASRSGWRRGDDTRPGPARQVTMLADTLPHTPL
jgi:hypothetical protein